MPLTSRTRSHARNLRLHSRSALLTASSSSCAGGQRAARCISRRAREPVGWFQIQQERHRAARVHLRRLRQQLGQRCATIIAFASAAKAARACFPCVTTLHEGFAAAAELGPPTLDALRREMEAADCMHGMFVYHSLAGGTGSGLGSAITQVFDCVLSCSTVYGAMRWHATARFNPNVASRPLRTNGAACRYSTLQCGHLPTETL